MKSVESRIERLEAAAGLLGDSLDRISDAELDEMMVRAHVEWEAVCDAHGLNPTEIQFFVETETKPVLAVSRQFLPMSTDIEALELKRAGRVFYDECADLSVEQIHARVKAHVARLGLKESENGKP